MTLHVIYPTRHMNTLEPALFRAAYTDIGWMRSIGASLGVRNSDDFRQRIWHATTDVIEGFNPLRARIQQALEGYDGVEVHSQV